VAADTIFALATPPGRSGIAVFRISGPDAVAAAAALGARRLAPRRAALRRLRDPRDGSPLDDGLVLHFAAPASYTGEDVVELQVHGSPAVARALARALAALPRLRPAEAGEFTRRALLNGRLDLAQAEGLGDLLAAETAAQARQAMALMDGALSARAAGWRAQLTRAAALVETAIDFSDEDIPADALSEAVDLVACVAAELALERNGTAAVERLRGGYEVALVGAPNVGKSTLLNAIAGRDAALVSEVAGTTRDAIEVCLDLAGMPVTVVDLAGLREPGDAVERLGVERARRRAVAADLRVFLVDGEEDLTGLHLAPGPEDIVALAKADLRDHARGLAVSGRTGAGIGELLERITGILTSRVPTPGTASRPRHRDALERAIAALEAARLTLAAGGAPELAAEEIRMALRGLDFLIGRVDVEGLLDEIFLGFCIGK